jgi:hypothetical protein
MLPQFLLPETTVREAGTGPEIILSGPQARIAILTLGITRIVEQESLDVSIWGSADGAEWGAKPITSFPQKFYTGTYQLLVDLSKHPDVKKLRAKWTVNRWGKGEPKPLFTMYVFVQAMEGQLAAMSA